MIYSAEQIEQIKREESKVLHNLNELWMTLISHLAPTLESDRAKEYLLHGICRRLDVLHRCIRNVFDIFPVSREDLLTDVETRNIEINLHAFTINIYGLLDNVAWVFVFENSLEDKIRGGRRSVGLFSKHTMKHFPERTKQYLNSERMKAWYGDYAKNYRDALAHRIPPYVPPYNVTPENVQRHKDYDTKISELLIAGDFDSIDKLRDDQASIRSVCGAFLHSYSDSDAARPVMFHAQMLADSNTVIEVISIVILKKNKDMHNA